MMFRPGIASRLENERPSTVAMIEHLEPRQLFAAALKVDNLDVLPGFERLIFNRIKITNQTFPNYVKERGTLRITNTGDQTLRFTSVTVKGPFRILGLPPKSIPAGKSVLMTVQFTATKPPPFTNNQTAGFDNMNKAGTYVGSMVFKTNDPNNATYTEGLAGWFQMESEKNQEPNLQTIINLISDYKTNIAPNNTVLLTQPVDQAKYYGEEVVSAYWTVANTSRPVGIRHLASFHTQGEPVRAYWFRKSDGIANQVLMTEGLSGQSFLPYKQGQKGVPAATSFSPGATTVFGFKLDNEWSDDTKNTQFPSGGGHKIRFYPVRDHFGNELPNLYFATMDYSFITSGGAQNWDFQDNVYLVTNIQPAGN